ncbi:antitoxin ChpS [Gellertiella hungarica]|uniref:Antitoxin ChpS n=2 Tax=Gellertiella hungarica TaxID=1572859 RepID=A0A7W6J4E8_9HYPH|nr:PbsX family transcriptional regulator [Gellertiella hungarica]MBB4064572.1 antitoxin ChpS [Gellertiella hungarica]
MTIPPAILKLMGAEVGGELVLAVRDGTLVASPVKAEHRRYSLAELLEGSEDLDGLSREIDGFGDGEAMGKEVL